MWNLNYYINELTYKTETDPQIERRDSWLPGAEVRDGLGVCDYQMQTIVYRMDKKGPTV